LSFALFTHIVSFGLLLAEFDRREVKQSKDISKMYSFTNPRAETQRVLTQN